MATTASHTAMDESLPDFSAQFLSDLQGLLEKAGRFTGATSAAIAFVEGEELVTKVSMGECAPDPGSRSPISGSFTGLCVQQHDVQRCDDASKDERVDSAACEALGISSMVIVPIAEKQTVLGVLAAFSAKPNAFSPTHVALLRTIADIVIELRKRYPADPHPAGFGATAKTEPVKPAPQVDSPLVHSAPDFAAAAEVKAPVVKTPETRAVSTVLPTFASAATETNAQPKAHEVTKSESEVKTAAELHATMAAIPVPEQKKQEKVELATTDAPKQEEIQITEAKPAAEKKALGPVLVKPEAKPKVEHSVELWKREPLVINNPEEADEYARVVPNEPKKDSEVVSTAADIGFTPVVNDEDVNAQQPMFGYGYNTKPSSRGGRSISILKVMLAVLGLVAFTAAASWFFKHYSPVEQPHAVQAAAPHVQPVAPVTEPQSSPSPMAPDTAATPDNSGPAVAMVLKKTDLKLPGGKKDSKITDSVIVPDETIILNGGTVPKRTGDETVAPPKVTADGTSGMGNILSMVKPTTQPQTAFHSSSISAPELIKQVAPQFPPFARQMHIQGDRVVLNGTVGKDGSVSNIKVIRGKQVFVGPAVSAVRQWKYKPATLNGQPTPSTVEIVVNFVDR